MSSLGADVKNLFGDAALLNAVLRATNTDSNFTELYPTITVAAEKDHFFEIQHIVALIYADPPLIDVTDLYSIPFGYFVVLATYINDRRNIYRIPKSVNQAKKKIPLTEYAPSKHNASIAEYLTATAQKGLGRRGQVQVLDNLKDLVGDMITAGKKYKYAELTGAVAARLVIAMEW